MGGGPAGRPVGGPVGGPVGPPARRPVRGPTAAARAAGRLLLALAVLVAFLGAGMLVAHGTGLPVPGSVLGMVLLTVALQLGIVRLSWVRPAADLLLRHMGLLFVPPGVAVILHAELIRSEWLPILAGSAISTLAVLLTVGWVQQRMERGS